MNLHLNILLTLPAAFFINACSFSSEQGPVGMDSIQNAQKRGSMSTDQYEIIDITSHNINHYNKSAVSSRNELPEVDYSKTYSDAIRPYDQLTLQVIDTAQTGGLGVGGGSSVQFGPIEVPQSGKISVPYAGDFSIIGKELTEIQKDIQDAYSTVFNTARVTVGRISRLALRANVIGIAQQPGQQVIDREGVNLADLVAKSGGTLQEPFTCEYLLHRKLKTYILNNNDITNENILVMDGDVLEIRKSNHRTVTLLGAVVRPGSYPFPNYNSKLDDFIGGGGGFRSDSANLSGVFVFRQMPTKKTHIYRFDMRDPAGVIAAGNFSIHGKDIIYVTEAPLARWNRTIRSILPFGQAYNMGGFSN
jgi:polysaccharide export outer membrane protein